MGSSGASVQSLCSACRSRCFSTRTRGPHAVTLLSLRPSTQGQEEAYEGGGTTAAHLQGAFTDSDQRDGLCPVGSVAQMRPPTRVGSPWLRDTPESESSSSETQSLVSEETAEKCG